MNKYKVLVRWTMEGEIEVEANNVQEAMQKVKDGSDPLPEGYYLSDSFTVDKEATEEIHRHTLYPVNE